MRLDTSQQMRQEMRMKLAPRMIQSMEILQLPILALQERINQELVENPTLEQREAESEAEEPSEPSENAESEPSTIEQRELVVDERHDNEADFERLESLDEDWSEHFRATHRVSRGASEEAGDRKHDAMQNMASRPQTLQDYLYQQLGFLDAPNDIRELAQFIIFNLDDNGWLSKLSLEEVARAFGNGATLQQAEEALDLVQKLDPPGVGARDLRECLLLQITPETPSAEMLRTIVANHLEDVGKNRLPVIQKRTGYSMDQIKAAIEQIQKDLKPKPGANFSSQTIAYVVPDLIVDQDDEGEYHVRLVDEHIPHLHISRRYHQMLKDRSTSPEAREFIQRKIQAARWLIESIEQRRSTILKVAKAITNFQREFLDKGSEHIQPLKMQEIAERVGVHVTTVSRAVDDKWIQTPRGIFPLKRFFGGGTTTASGEEVAWEIVQQKLKEVIDQEDKANPLSDDEIVAKFKEQGIDVARRTITKYRKKMGIPSSRERKQF